MTDTPTYVCIDCKANVYDALDVVRERCLTCQWIEDIEEPHDREQLRAWLDSFNGPADQPGLA